MMCGRGAVDANAAAQQQWHLQPAAAHVLHLGDLIDELSQAIEDEIDEHEIHHRTASSHCSPGAQADEAAFADRRVAESLGPETFKEAGGRVEVAAPLADPFAQHEDI